MGNDPLSMDEIFKRLLEADILKVLFIISLSAGPRGIVRRRASKLSAVEILTQKYAQKAEYKEKELEVRKQELEFQQKNKEERKAKLELEFEERRAMLALLKDRL